MRVAIMNTAEFLIFATARSESIAVAVADNKLRRVRPAYWFLPREYGYTPDVNAAGRFSVKRSVEIMKQSRGEDFPVDAQLFIKDAKDSFHLMIGPDNLLIVDLLDEYNIAIVNGYRDFSKYLDT